MDFLSFSDGEKPVVFNPNLAQNLGLVEAVFLQKLHERLERRHIEAPVVERNGQRYAQVRLEQLMVGGVTERQLLRTVTHLKDAGIVSIHRSRPGQTEYSINYPALQSHCDQKSSTKEA